MIPLPPALPTNQIEESSDELSVVADIQPIQVQVILTAIQSVMFSVLHYVETLYIPKGIRTMAHLTNQL
jgi:hypothetical protein